MDQELRDLLTQLWPGLSEEKLDLILPRIERHQLTVGRLYSGLTILENWRNYRASMRRKNALKNEGIS